MASVIVPRPVAAAMLMATTLLLALNILLLSKNEALTKRLQNLLNHDFTPVGVTLPELAGMDINGKPMAISPAGSATFVILAFNTDCHVCDENWPAWDRLVADPSMRHAFSFVSFRSDVSKSYLEQHHMNSRATVIGLDPGIARSYNLTATPQTILVKDGKVVNIWPGILTDRDVSEIRTAVKKAMDKAS